MQIFRLIFSKGRAIAQALSRWLPSAAAIVRARSSHVGFVVDKVVLGQVFSEYFDFLYQSFHQFLHHHNHEAGTIGLLVAAVPSGPSWAPTPPPSHYSKLYSLKLNPSAVQTAKLYF
jgi:hypothetical protein